MRHEPFLSTRATDAVRAAAPRWPVEVVTDVATRAVRDALATADDVRTFEPELVFGDLALRMRDDPDRFLAMVVALAALVPLDQSPHQLLAWTQHLEVPA